MVASFAVLFFATAAKAGIEPPQDFAVASAESVAVTFALAMTLLFLVTGKAHRVGVFTLIKALYTASILVLTVSIAFAKLRLDPLMGIAFNACALMLVMVLWLLGAFVAHTDDVEACKVAGLALGIAALAMAAGWVAGVSVRTLLIGDRRALVSAGLACTIAVFSTIGFSSDSFPYLTNGGEGARKMRRIREAAAMIDVDYYGLIAQQAGLSERECEVFRLLLEGDGAATIAEKLVVSYSTARTHVRNVYRKFGVHSQTELLVVCERFKNKRVLTG